MSFKPDSPNKKQFSLTQRALLTFVSNMLGQVARFLTSFFVTPIVTNGLGLELYGAWTMLQQTIGYFSLSDLRPTGALKFFLGVKQHQDDTEEKQRLIGATLLIWVLSLPITLVIAAVLIWFVPEIVRVSSPNVIALRITLAILLINTVLDRVLSIPFNVLRAQNLDYLGMGINTTTILVGGFASGVAILAGWGLTGLATITTISSISTSLARLWVARKALPWLTARKPKRDEFVKFGQTSGWLFFAALAGLLVYSSDILLVGIVLGPAVSAVYASTGMVLRMAGEPLYQLISSGNSGLVGLCGQEDWERVAAVRKEVYFLALFLMNVLGIGVIALNRAFISLWLGPEFFGGINLSFTLVIVFMLTFVTRTDLVIMDAILFVKQKSLSMFAGGAIGLILGVVLLKTIGITGMAYGCLAGNIIIFVSAWVTIWYRMGSYATKLGKDLFRPLVSMAISFVCAYYAQLQFHFDNWGEFITATVFIGLVGMLIGWFLILKADVRVQLLERAQYNIPFLRRS